MEHILWGSDINLHYISHCFIKNTTVGNYRVSGSRESSNHTFTFPCCVEASALLRYPFPQKRKNEAYSVSDIICHMYSIMFHGAGTRNLFQP